MTTPRTLVFANLVAIALIGCAKNSNEVWSTKSESLVSRPNRASVSADDQPIPGTRVQNTAPAPQAKSVDPPDVQTSEEPADTHVVAPAAPAAPREEPQRETEVIVQSPVEQLGEPGRIDTRLSRDSTAVSSADRQRAIEILLKAADARNSLLRANAIESIQPATDYVEPVVRRGLGDENRGVRFVAAMTVGRLKLESLAPLLEPMLHDESPSVQAAAIYGLQRCGRTVNPTPLATMLTSEDPEVKGNAALILGDLGDRSAIQMLENAVGRGLNRVAPARVKIVELQLAEAMVKLGAYNQVVPIRAALFAPAEEAELVALACQMCGRMRDAKAAPDLNNLLIPTGPQQRPPEVRLAAVAALAQVDPRKAYPEVALVYINSEDFQVRAQAATTLGIIADRRTLPQLAQMMNDPNPFVQTAAAGAVLLIDKR